MLAAHMEVYIYTFGAVSYSALQEISSNVQKYFTHKSVNMSAVTH